MGVREQRRRLGWSQADLAARAGVSRQLVSAVESGRHDPGVSAALAIAGALGVTVESLFTPGRPSLAATPVTGERVPAGPVRVGMVRGVAVVAPVTPLDELDGAQADGRWSAGAVDVAEDVRPAGAVLAGCEPALGVLANSAADEHGALWVKASSGRAREALARGRAHLAAVHDRASFPPAAPPGVVAFEIARWRVGVAVDRHRAGSAVAAVAAGGPVVQREGGAGVQRAFERWLRREQLARPRGPRASGHVEVCRLVAAGAAPGGVTTEPAAVAAGLAFEPLEEHVVQLWCPEDVLAVPAVAALLDRFTSTSFRDRVAALPAYDVAGIGKAIG